MVTHARSPHAHRSPRVHRRRRRQHSPPKNPQPPRSPQPCPSLIGHEMRTPMSHEDPHLRPLFSRVISSKAQLSHMDPHSFPFINKEYEAQCHTRTLTHDPFIEVHEAACAQHSRSLSNRIYEATSHEDPHLRPLLNRVKTSKAHSSHQDPHSFPFINKEYEAHCHTRTLSHGLHWGKAWGGVCQRWRQKDGKGNKEQWEDSSQQEPFSPGRTTDTNSTTLQTSNINQTEPIPLGLPL